MIREFDKFNEINMIKRYNQYIKESHLDVDPFGEEDWDDENLSPVLMIARQQGEPFDQIIDLYLEYENLDNLEGIENLINLEALYCGQNRLTTLEGIENLTNLKILSCYSNRLTNLDEIWNLTNLQFLYCSNNQLTNLNGIENLTHLKILSCSENQFSKEYKKYLFDYCKKKEINLYL